jgi:hypothetical protein
MSGDHQPASLIYSIAKLFCAPQIVGILVQSEDQDVSVIGAYFHPSEKQKAVLSDKIEYSFSTPELIMFC